MPSYRAFVALGANLGDARATLMQALQSLAQLPQTSLVRASSIYRTAPVDASGPDFINAVAELHTTLAPHALLDALQGLEQVRGRQRPYRNAPRTLDLDIIGMWSLHDQPAAEGPPSQLQLATPTLTLPHPRWLARAFVLVPMAEIAPALVSPEQLAAVADQAIERLTPAP